MVVGRNIEDPEQGKRGDLTYIFWVTDISKNSVLILNVSPKADGTIPEKAQHILLGMGRWLSVNGKAICGTTLWIIAGEGPIKLEHEGVSLITSGCNTRSRTSAMCSTGIRSMPLCWD